MPRFLISLTAGVLALPALAQQADVADWDTDGDGMIAETEFADGYRTFDEYDPSTQSEDTPLTEDEFYANRFGEFDSNRDGLIDPDEASGIGPGLGDLDESGF